MSTFTNQNTQGDAQTALFHIHLSEDRVVDELLDLHSPIYLLVKSLVDRHQLPVVGSYRLFAGSDHHLLSNELALKRTPYAGGGDLYLATSDALWWAAPSVVATPSVVGTARPPTRPIAARAPIVMTPQSMLLAGIGIVALVLLGFLFWPQGAKTTGITETPIVIMPPNTAAVEATATLLPATPTLEPAAQAAQTYQDGLKAYEAQGWPQASALFQLVYEYDPNDEKVREALAATHYNWGIATRDQGNVAAARDHFHEALAVDPNHQLASTEQAKAALFLAAGQAAAKGDSKGAIELYRELLKQNGGDYVGTTALLYELLVARAAELGRTDDVANLRAAYSLYREARGLTLPDTSVAQQGMAAIQPRLPQPTATPRPTARPTPQPTRPPQTAPARLRFRAANYNDDPTCISVQITGIGVGGWAFIVDGIRGVTGGFDGGGNARACGLNPGQEVTITIVNGNGQVVPGGAGVPAKGSAIMVASWR